MLLAILFILFLVVSILWLFFKIFGLIFLKLLAIGLTITVGSIALILLIFGIII